MTSEEYDKLRQSVIRYAGRYRFQIADCEDILQDIALKILENKIPNDKWGSVLFSVVGAYSQKRHRAMQRLTSIEDMEYII